MAYNGWDNYETWAASLWLGDDDTLQDLVEEAGSVHGGADAIKDYVESLYYDAMDEPLKGTLFGDLMAAAMGSINWYELADYYKPESWGKSNTEPDTCTWCDRTLTGNETIPGVCEDCHNED
jgi:hypothetical protein